MLGNILLSVVSFCTFVSYAPQVIKLIKTKKSDDLSVSSWIIWVISSLSYTIYAIFVSKDILLIFETSMELFFCLLILVLTCIYRNNNYELICKELRKNKKTKNNVNY